MRLMNLLPGDRKIRTKSNKISKEKRENWASEASYLYLQKCDRKCDNGHTYFFNFKKSNFHIQNCVCLYRYYCTRLNFRAKNFRMEIQRKIRVNVARFARKISKTLCSRSHCSKSSFFVQKFNFHFSRKLSIFLGEKLVKMLWFWTF